MYCFHVRYEANFELKAFGGLNRFNIKFYDISQTIPQTKICCTTHTGLNVTGYPDLFYSPNKLFCDRCICVRLIVVIRACFQLNVVPIMRKIGLMSNFYS